MFWFCNLQESTENGKRESIQHKAYSCIRIFQSKFNAYININLFNKNKAKSLIMRGYFLYILKLMWIEYR